MKTSAFDALSPAAREFFLRQIKDFVSIGLSEPGIPLQEKFKSLVCDRLFSQGFMFDGEGLIGFFHKYDFSDDVVADEGLDVAELNRLGLNEGLLKQEALVADMRQLFDCEFERAWKEERPSEGNP